MNLSSNAIKLMLFVFILLSLLLSGCLESVQMLEENNNGGLNDLEEFENNSFPVQDSFSGEKTDLNGVEISLSILTDRNEYGSNEEAVITVVANSSKNIEGAVVKVWGIAPYGSNYIEVQKIFDLIEGENRAKFVAETPYCTSGCGGVYPGPYDLYASIEYNGEELTGGIITIMLTKN